MIDAETKLIALIGNPVGHSFGPLMHNAAFQSLGLNYAYLAFNVSNLKAAVEAMKSLGFAGYSVTLPHKEKIIKHLDRVDSLAAKIGAVNTVVNKDGILLGHNTDAPAAITALKQKTSLAGKNVALLGAGGAARAIAFALQDEKAKTTIFNRTFVRAKRLAMAVGCEYAQIEKLRDFKADVIVNATSIGMHPNIAKSPVERNVLKPGMVVFDAVYNPMKTTLLKQAEARGCETVSGLEMFIEQGALQLKLWTGSEAPKELMRNTILEGLQK